MVMEPPLPNVFAVLLVTKALECTDKTGDPRSSFFGCVFPVVDGNQQMDMIGHNYVLVHGKVIVKSLHLLNILIGNGTMP